MDIKPYQLRILSFIANTENIRGLYLGYASLGERVWPWDENEPEYLKPANRKQGLGMKTSKALRIMEKAGLVTLTIYSEGGFDNWYVRLTRRGENILKGKGASNAG